MQGHQGAKRALSPHGAAAGSPCPNKHISIGGAAALFPEAPLRSGARSPGAMPSGTAIAAAASPRPTWPAALSPPSLDADSVLRLCDWLLEGGAEHAAGAGALGPAAAAPAAHTATSAHKT